MQLYNTRTKQQEPFQPLKKEIGMYTCGPTVYNYAHVGNLRSFLTADVLKRVLTYLGYEVKQVMNITDVGHLTSDADSGEDKMLKGAAREHLTVWDVAKKYTAAFMHDVERLNILKPEVLPKATEHIKDMITFIQKLEEKGFTYEAGGNIYFDTTKFPRYADFAKLPPIEDAQERVESDTNKKHPRDFVLWFTKSKFKEQEMKWDSPWGEGYPGWHIECSVMSTKYLGEQFDIHTGGIDHIQVHHTNEVAQSECYMGKHPWVNFWVHTEFLRIGQDKMAKSGENFITLQTLIDKGYNAMHYRYFTYTAHYRQALSFTWESLDAAKNAYERLKKKVLTFKQSTNEEGTTQQYETKFKATLEDDMNMPNALAVVWEMMDDTDVGEKKRLETLKQFDKVLGLRVAYMEEEKVEVSTEIQQLVNEREQARKEKDFTKADEIRDTLLSKGFVLEDSDDGVKIRKK